MFIILIHWWIQRCSLLLRRRYKPWARRPTLWSSLLGLMSRWSWEGAGIDEELSMVPPWGRCWFRHEGRWCGLWRFRRRGPTSVPREILRYNGRRCCPPAEHGEDTSAANLPRIRQTFYTLEHTFSQYITHFFTLTQTQNFTIKSSRTFESTIITCKRQVDNSKWRVLL